MVCKSPYLFIALTLSALLLYGCKPISENPEVRDGKAYCLIKRTTFKGRWWHYYERALSCAEGAFWERAERDFREAIHIREKDERRARTYGMHFLDYFPHRELGILYYQTGRTREAHAELELSLGQFPSDKARYSGMT